jgi:four helix bundle protein
VSANLAEGFGRYYPRENAYFVRVAKASLAETQDALLKCRRRKYWPPADFERAWRLSCRTMKAVPNYLRYLESCDGEIPGKPQPPDPPPEEP